MCICVITCAYVCVRCVYALFCTKQYYSFRGFQLVPFNLLQGKTTPSFEEVWPAMRPIVLKVLKQEPVTQAEWQDLFYGVHLICLWDEKGAAKIYECLQEDIVAFINVSDARIEILFFGGIIN